MAVFYFSIHRIGQSQHDKLVLLAITFVSTAEGEYFLPTILHMSMEGIVEVGPQLLSAIANNLFLAIFDKSGMHKFMNHQQNNAFSLIELSIVLVILGLLTGGILAGQSLIRAAELRSITTEEARLRTAIMTFRDKYFQLPGDFNQANRFWGTAGGVSSSTSSACSTALRASATTGTCNGGGNGMLDQESAIEEWQTIWNHLGLAGLIEGSYQYGPTTYANALAGTHYPASRIGQNVGWAACYTHRGNFGRGSRNMLILSQPSWSTSACEMGRPAGISGPEGWNLDTKMDDGNGGTGRITATNSYNGPTGCVTTGGAFSSETLPVDYILNGTVGNCHLYFVLGL